MKRYPPMQIIEAYKAHNIKPSKTWFYHTNDDGSVEACPGGMIMLVNNSNAFTSGTKESTKGIHQLVKDVESKAYALGLVFGFTSRSPSYIFSLMRENNQVIYKTTGKNGNPFDSSTNWDEFALGVEDAREVAKLMNVEVHNENVVTYAKENWHKLDPIP